MANSTRDSAGVLLVENRHARWNGKNAWRVDTPAALSRRNRSSDEGKAKGLTSGADHVSPFGETLSKPTAQAIELRFFHERGRFLRAVGRRAAGPGEFVPVNNLFHAAGDSLLVVSGMAAGSR